MTSSITENSYHSVPVALGEQSYDILVGEGLLSHAGAHIAPLLPAPKVIIITDTEVASRHLNTLEHSLSEHNIQHHSITLPNGEKTKSFAELEKLLSQILALTPDRKTTLLALGGGVIGDITGFAASILLRGVPFIQIPTTLLAMVDSSVGGKTGINTAYGKNLVGSFYQPRLVLSDISTLATLPKRELLAGYAEVVKYGLIDDATFFEKLEKTNILYGDTHALAEAIITSCQAKARIVAEDEKEKGVRALLNLGHTFGHALEAELGYDGRLLHGEAVALGMVMAFGFSEQQGLSPSEDTQRVIQHLQAVGLPTSLEGLGQLFFAQDLLRHMFHDKKTSEGKLTFILARGIGQSFIQTDVSPDAVSSFLTEFIGQQ